MAAEGPSEDPVEGRWRPPHLKQARRLSACNERVEEHHLARSEPPLSQAARRLPAWPVGRRTEPPTFAGSPLPLAPRIMRLVFASYEAIGTMA